VRSTVTLITRFVLTVIRTKIFGWPSAPTEISGKDDIVRISGYASGQHIDGYPEPIDPNSEF
jgi:hypothetical protein